MAIHILRRRICPISRKNESVKAMGVRLHDSSAKIANFSDVLRACACHGEYVGRLQILVRYSSAMQFSDTEGRVMQESESEGEVVILKDERQDGSKIADRGFEYNVAQQTHRKIWLRFRFTLQRQDDSPHSRVLTLLQRGDFVLEIRRHLQQRRHWIRGLQSLLEVKHLTEGHLATRSFDEITHGEVPTRPAVCLRGTSCDRPTIPQLLADQDVVRRRVHHFSNSLRG